MKFKKTILAVMGIVLVVLFFNMFTAYQKNETKLTLEVQVNSDRPDDYQLFYIMNKDQEWTEEQSLHQNYERTGDWVNIEYDLPKDVYSLRLDLGNQKATVKIKDVKLTGNSSVNVPLGEIISEEHEVKLTSQKEKQIELQVLDSDPFVILDIKAYRDAAIEGNSFLNIALVSLSSVVATLISLYVINSIKEVYKFMKEIFMGRKLIFSLAKNDFKTKYASSYLGIVWGFIQPLLTIVTYWFVFQVGLRSGSVSDVPFILWFIVAIIPWFFFSEALSSATNVYTEYSYLVKKVVFKIELLPIVKIISALFVHLFFILFIFVMYTGYGYYPDSYSFQMLYYLICTIMLVFSVSLVTSAIVLFFKDLNQIIIIILQIGFWFTPIGWSYTMLPNFWSNVFKLNPMFYIVEGYRDTFIYGVSFIEHPYYTLYFWMFCLTALVVGIKSLKKLKPHFADVI
ncbi:teichoic acid transport system permease protein [Paenibacillus sp. PastF-3]|uniref:ABC transporter permease n=1 Tax=Paenibacillus sp. PastF-3 TaxID=2940626 RepID=UPI002475BE20|nr:ABC transporter permease [Paenibacillus sp. PastF-3]MDH6370979.1 teichoic acid transport system permease protein [Paenibacillus sp. PastF-3]